ncbi:aminotransferase class III-fold pyridoxal phosphate-dependent enzyme [Neptuniibacter pectenicola]|jgi:acetylornithine/N-succinyldiaminopimelate aminotransferase|uniref:Aminotransferase class III-fold pyridoxal phosphate-dependent enzyme n=1 Tax=Neptuniibacter pectenicola TaxID=1806669 RepID=A0ABU9TUJ8_9GAMM|nr:aminotransferase class III-fold pyridoxal phosphate-dependent enzyme [Neptuniibacter pectenicola]KXJ54660.1 MAG: acetylornithine aminotransferase [Neptuniibacter sp. Phe_28]
MQSNIPRETFEQSDSNGSPLPITPASGQGSHIWDQANNEYIDFAGGISINTLGYCHPQLIQAFQQQTDTLWQINNVWAQQPALQLAKALCEKTFAHHVHFATSGADAIAAAFKLARTYALEHFGPKKTEIIRCKNKKNSPSTEYTPEDTTYVAFNNIDNLKCAINNNTCAVVIEPIQEENELTSADPSYLKSVRALCDHYSALLIFDEIQTGMGRTGKLFAYQHYNVIPDILTSANALASGLPLAAMLCNEAVTRSLQTSTPETPYSGNPLACAIANKVLSIIDTSSVLDGVERKHTEFINQLERANQLHPVFKTFRGQGLLMGCLLLPEYQGKAYQLMQIALEEGVIVLTAGENMIRLTPSLIIPTEDISAGIERLSAAMRRFIKLNKS